MKDKFIYSISLSKLVFLLFVMASISACNSGHHQSGHFDYGTMSDSARYYYHDGYHEILDNGRWTESERSYRKALEFDPDFALGKSLVGRITRDLNEREKLLQSLLEIRKHTTHDENLLLDVYLLNIEAYNDRDKGIKVSAEFNSKRSQLAESNFREFVHKYPEDDYAKAEYIEWLHFIHGPRAALDTLNKLATDRQMKLGFYIGFSASLELELGNVDRAISLSKRLKELMIDSSYTRYLSLKTEIYLAQDSLIKAKETIDRVVNIDPNHIIALGEQAKINEKLKGR